MAPEIQGHPTEQLPSSVNNRGLFSDYYLAELVWEDEFFRGSAKGAEAVWHAAKALYEKEKAQLPTASEAQTEQLFIRPVLEILGYKDLYAVQPSGPSPEGLRRPDFALFSSRQDKQEAEAESKGKAEYFARALAIGDAKQWDRSLDRKRKGAGDTFSDANPSYQIDFYLRATDKKWGILTNGRRWRLYHRDTSYRMNVFYEVDVVAMLEKYDESFVYFYAFFRKEGLAAGFLDRAYRESREYTGKLGDEFKENVYEALRLLAEGLLKCPENELGRDDLEEIRANTFVLIYRILFLFYAEDRELLPTENPEYRSSYSLRGWARDIARRLDEGHSFSPTAYGAWGKLTELFRIVNEGDSHLGVLPYNGGLFDDAKHPALARWRIGDAYLAMAIDQLARAAAAGRSGRGPVSYRDLEIRHIGAVYEGLLEHHLRVADQDLAVVKEQGKEKFTPLAELGSRRRLKTYRAGEVYLETDKGERKATGSYYTPDYIVKYIVEHTLGPLVEEKRRQIKEESRQLREKVKHSRGYDREIYQRKLGTIGNRLIEEILSIKVLDPAMGSGHFLVEAVDFLARALLEALGGAPEDSEEEDIRWAKREVVERCIFGVDVNPLAVELAKLSLWISTVAKDRPLSFLDHHLRLGNSLIGAWVKDLGMLPLRGKKDKRVAVGAHYVGIFEGELKKWLPTVIGEVMKLLRKPSDKVEDIREKEALYERILTLLQPFKEIANVWVSTYFGNEVGESDYENALLKLSDRPTTWKGEVRSQPWFAKAQEITKEHHFFHWELEFPEAFFEETGQRKRNPGFDAVVGNPPYGSPSDDSQKTWGRQRLKSVGAVIDHFAMFIESAAELCHAGGRLGKIVPSGWLTAWEHEPLRTVVLATTSPRTIVHLPYDVFTDAYIDTIVIIAEKRGAGVPAESVTVLVRRFPHRERLTEIDDDPASYDAMNTAAWVAHPQKLMTTVPGPGQWLWRWTKRNEFLAGGDLLSVSRGVTPFIEAQAGSGTKSAPGMCDSLDRYAVEPAGFVAVSYDPSLAEYRPPEVFSGQRFLVRRIISRQQRIIATVVRTYFIVNKSYLIAHNQSTKYSIMYALAVLASGLISKAFVAQSEVAKRDDFPQLDIATLRAFPIRRIAFTTPRTERTRLVDEGKRLYREALERVRNEGETERNRKEGSE